MATELIFVTGGVRSGKSEWALREASLLADGCPVAFIATARVDPSDADFEDRVEKHKSNRPDYWVTLEADGNLGSVVTDGTQRSRTVLIDDLTQWVSRLLLESGEDDVKEFRLMAELGVEAALSGLISALELCSATVIVVSGEVGAGVAPPTRLGNVFADMLGMVNARVAERADRAILMVSGLPVILKG
jgi:adenosylcobinamide kinase/adenosylcobinamide-phosphate guanylyltransferase